MKKLFLIALVFVFGVFASCTKTDTAENEIPDFLKESVSNEEVIAQFKELSVDETEYNKIETYLLDIGINEDDLQSVMRALRFTINDILTVRKDIITNRKEYVLNIRIKNYLKNTLKLTDEQIKLFKNLALRIAKQKKDRDIRSEIIKQFKKLDVSDAVIRSIHAYLLTIGIEADQMNAIMKVLLYAINDIGDNSDNYELSQRIQNYLKNTLGLTDRQIILIRNLAVRIYKNVKT